MFTDPRHKEPSVNVASVTGGFQVLWPVVGLVSVQMVNMDLACSSASPDQNGLAPEATMAVRSVGLIEDLSMFVHVATRRCGWVSLLVARKVAMIGQHRRPALSILGSSGPTAPEVVLVA